MNFSHTLFGVGLVTASLFFLAASLSAADGERLRQDPDYAKLISAAEPGLAGNIADGVAR
jgi:hypothetical protein